MKRPIPVVLSALLLGLLAFFLLILTAVMLFTGVAVLHHSLPQMAAAPSPFPPQFLPVMMFGFSLFYAAVAVWCILTLIGLLRLRSWARYSILVIAGLTAVFSGIAALFTIALPFLTPHLAGAAPASDPGIMRVIFLFIGLFYLIFTAIGIAMLVYFNRARTRTLFAQVNPGPFAPPNTFTGKHRPTAVAIVSWFFMICSPFCILYAAFPMPALIFGFPIYGFGARCVYAVFALAGFGVGYALYRLRPEAPKFLIAWMAFSLLNMAPVLTSWGQRNFAAYTAKFSPSGIVMPNLMVFVVFGFVFSLAFNGFILWLLYRHRAAFKPAALPPPLPPEQFLDAPLPG